MDKHMKTEKTYIKVGGLVISTKPGNVKVSLVEGDENREIIEKLGFNPESLPPTEVFTVTVTDELDTGRIEDFALHLRCYAQAIQALVEMYLDEKRMSKDDEEKKLSQSYAGWIDFQIEKLEEDVEKIRDYLTGVLNGEVIVEE